MSEGEISQTRRGEQDGVIPFPGVTRDDHPGSGPAQPRPHRAVPPPSSTASGSAPARETSASQVSFNRDELRTILGLYGRMVAAGEWRDYAIDFLRDRAIFSVFRRASEVPLYRIVKDPSLARRQGAYAVMAPSGQILKRGQDLDRVLRVMDPPRAVEI